MSSKTANYNLHKIDLNDSPPDITVLNQNFDIIDEKLKEVEDGSSDISAESIGALSTSGGEMTGQLQVPKILFDRSNGAYGDGGIYKANDSGNASTQIMDRGSNNKFAILAVNGQTQGLSLTFGTQNDDGTSTTTSVNQIYHEGNIPTPNKIGAVAKTGDTMSGNLEFKKAENGSSTIFKNHSSSADYGLVIKDTDKDGDYVSLSLQAANNGITFRDTSGIIHNIFHDGNTSKLATAIQSLIDSGVISMSAVKSVQRGVITASTDEYYNPKTTDKTINAVDMSKTMVLASSNKEDERYSLEHGSLYLYSSTKLRFIPPTSGSGSASIRYEVVEFH